ncbi:MAG: DUF359 domain-containing protein [Candidatus Micrarchaeota archaeon]
MRIPDAVRAKLKRPLGTLVTDYRRIGRLAKGRRVISVGDVCTLCLLAVGIRPHLAVFDHLFMRMRLDSGMVGALERNFSRPKRYRNPAGTLSEKILADAPALIRRGGAVLIYGEEDLTALAFILASGPKDVIVYGQPKKGMVVVLPDAKIKKKIAGWLSAAVAL